uniref:Uncharacterized protein n=1 Tax=Ditylenchus dipsaci TaxID=166011 RepID=A0A915DWS2_9BILA
MDRKSSRHLFSCCYTLLIDQCCSIYWLLTERLVIYQLLSMSKLPRTNYHILSQKSIDKAGADCKRGQWEEIFNQCVQRGHEWTEAEMLNGWLEQSGQESLEMLRKKEMSIRHKDQMVD